MHCLADELQRAAEDWNRRDLPTPGVVLVTGSALKIDLGSPICPPLALSELLPFEIHAVEGHALSLELYEPVPGRYVAAYRGRLHCYQGFDPHQVVFSVRLAGLLGARTAIVTNAAGSLNPDHPPGKLVAISDHLNLSGLNPLVGRLPDAWGPRFPDLNQAYAPRLRELAHRCAGELGIELGDGVYAWLLGPSYETPAEIEMVRRIGGDLVGMSTVPEVIAARHLGMSCLGLSLVTNLAAGLASEPPSHREVVQEGRRSQQRVADLLSTILHNEDLDQPGATT